MPELDLSVTINLYANEFSAEAVLKLDASKKYVFELALGLEVDTTKVDAVAAHTRNIGHTIKPANVPPPL